MIFSNRRFVKISALLQTASFLAIGNVLAAQAQTAQTAAADQAVPEQVLVTGSLIHGAATVGVPVTNLSDQDFKETGSLTVADVLKELPSVTVKVADAINENGGEAIHNQDISIHNIRSSTASEALMLVDGMRSAPQGLSFCTIDPSIIPTLALERVDVLADGASATYGSDALSGVVNVIMRKGFDGAITQLQYGQSTDIGGSSYDAQQLYGRKWDSGDVTVSYEYYDIEPIQGPARSYFTTNYSGFGYQNANPLGVSMPGVVSTGAAKAVAGVSSQFNTKTGNFNCSNCYSIPSGTGWNYGAQNPGPTTSWATLLGNPGVLNEKNPASYADVLPASVRNGATLTFDQNIFQGISFFFEGFYSERRGYEQYTPGASPDTGQAISGVTVPTINPYYPSGAPTNLRINYNLGAEMNEVTNSIETAGRFAFGFNAELPFGWLGKIYYNQSIDHSLETNKNMVNNNNVTAALGGTVSVAPGTINPNDSGYTFTKPSNIPYLNVFCDATQFRCNSPTTLAYIQAFRNTIARWNLNEIGINLDGPIFDLPGGQVKAAVGAQRFGNDTLYQVNTNYNTASNTITSYAPDPESYNDWAVYGELEIPIIGDANQLPLVESFSIDASYRYDNYNLFGSVAVPKVAGNWTIADGFSIRANWGKGYRAPVPAEYSPLNGATIEPYTIAAGATQDSIQLTCDAVRNLPGGVAHAGSLVAALNPTCATAESVIAPGVIQIGGGSGASAALRTGTGISPERSNGWNLGFNFTPTDPYLKGLSTDVTWYNLIINGYVNGNGTGISDPNDPLGKVCVATSVQAGCLYYIRPSPNLPITDPTNALFYKMVTAEAANPRSQTFDPTTIQVIWDTAETNTGFSAWSGLDVNVRYDIDLGDLGAWNVGVNGNYQLSQNSQALNGLPIQNFFYGEDSGGRLHYRARLGWTSTGGDLEGLSITGFMNFIPHSPNPITGYEGGGNIPPSCFWGVGFSAGSCYPGSPYYGPFTTYPGATPGLYTFDTSFGYTTGNRPANQYLRNVNFQLTVLNILDKAPPFQYNLSSNRSVAAQIANSYGISPLGRYINFAITKSW